MTIAALDERSRTIQAVGVPASGETEVLAFTDTSANSNRLGADVYRFLATENVHIATSAPATTSDLLLLANREEYFRVGEGTVISAIRNTTNGSLLMTRME